MESGKTELAELIACPSCYLLLRRAAPEPGEVARCPRCRGTLARGRRRSIDRSLALATGALICLVVALCCPLLHLASEGRSNSSTIVDGAIALAGEGSPALAILVFGASVAVPLLRLSGLIALLVPLRLGHRPAFLPATYRRLEGLAPWAMLEVYLLGLLVAFVKLGDVADVAAGTALYAFVAFIFLATATQASLDPHLVFGTREEPS